MTIPSVFERVVGDGDGFGESESAEFFAEVVSSSDEWMSRHLWDEVSFRCNSLHKKRK